MKDARSCPILAGDIKYHLCKRFGARALTSGSRLARIYLTRLLTYTWRRIGGDE